LDDPFLKKSYRTDRAMLENNQISEQNVGAEKFPRKEKSEISDP
jgi:hypothetical protein